MSNEKKRIFKQRMTALHDKYCKQLPEKYHEIERSWKEYQTDFNNTVFFDTFYRYIHTLKGTAATFGFNTQADICFDVQQILTSIKEQHASPDEAVEIINEHLDRLKEYINAPADKIEN